MRESWSILFVSFVDPLKSWRRQELSGTLILKEGGKRMTAQWIHLIWKCNNFFPSLYLNYFPLQIQISWTLNAILANNIWNELKNMPKNINMKKGSSSVQTASPTRVEVWIGTKFHGSCLNHSYRDVQRSSIDLKENLLRSLILNL